ncbi:hypothetical protein RND81_02G091000 [Saponaria officinalis]|uniref:Pentatricopeptide repeat-containing protein n=1 Tax=Saponaria officinalis TaxID=3572 RepID=A0AAW1MVB9_SAPOF
MISCRSDESSRFAAFLFSAAAESCFLVTGSSSDEQKSSIADDIYKFEYHLHELDTDRVIDGLVNLRRVPKQAFSFFLRVKSCGFRHNVETYMSVIEILCNSASSTMLEAMLSEVINSKNETGFDSSELLEDLLVKLVHQGTRFPLRALDALVKVYVNVGMFDECMDILFQMGSRGFVPCVFSCNFLLNRLIECGKSNNAVTVYQQLKKWGLNPNEMKDAGVNPNVYSFTIYIEGLCFNKKPDLAYEALKGWRLSSAPFDNFAYDVVVRGFCNEKRLIEAEGVLVDIEKQGSIPGVYCFGALIRAYCKSGDIQKALSLERDMVSKGVKTNCVIITSILQCLVSMGLLADAIGRFREYDDSGVFLDKVCYNVVLDAMCKMGKLEEASKLLDEMKRRNIVPDLIHYSTLINGYCLNGKVLDACTTFKEMKSKGFEPHIITYNILAGGLARNGLAKEAVKEAELFLRSLDVKHPDNYSSMISGYCEARHTIEAFKLFLNLYKQGIKIKKKTTLKLLDSLCMEGELESAFVLFETLVVSEDNPCIIAYSKLMAALCNAGDIKKARLVFDYWVDIGLTPDTIMYTIMINGYCKSNFLIEAFDLFESMKSRGISPDVITYTVLLDGGFKSSLKHCSSNSKYPKVSSGEKAKMFESAIRSKMQNMQQRPDDVCYTVLIDIRCKFNSVEDAIKLFQEMKDCGLQPDVFTYTALISGCCRIGDVDTAMTLVDVMEAQGVLPDQITISVVKHSILRVNKM